MFIIHKFNTIDFHFKILSTLEETCKDIICKLFIIDCKILVKMEEEKEEEEGGILLNYLYT